MLIACPGEFPVYQMLPAPLATQQGALRDTKAWGRPRHSAFRCRPLWQSFGLCAGVKPSTLPQNASPRGTMFASLGSGMEVLVPFNTPLSWVSGSCNRDPDLKVTAAQLLPTAICAAEGSERLTTGPSTNPHGQAWLWRNRAHHEQLVFG